mgnify:CR=1 FL=1
MRKIYNSVIEFFKDSYKFSPFAFYCELIEAVMLIGASAVLTYTVLDPAIWFVVMNSIAMVQLFWLG